MLFRSAIGDCAFRNCTSLTEIVIPDGVTKIGYETLYNCSSLARIIVGAGVISVGGSAFFDCTSLTSVYYKGTVKEWAKIKVDDLYNEAFTSATRYYYVENAAEVPAYGGNYWHYNSNGEVVCW